MLEWRQFVMDLKEFEPDCIETVLLRHGAHAVTLTDAGDDPVLEPGPGEMPLWRETRITALFSADADFDSLRTELGQVMAIDPLPEHHVEPLHDRVWEREWLKDFRPMRFGRRLWISPDNALPDARDDAIVVHLDEAVECRILDADEQNR